MTRKRETKRRKQRESERKARSLTVGTFEKIMKESRADIADAAEKVVKRSVGRPKGSKAFDRVKRAKEILAESSTVAARLIVKAAKVAANQGDSRPAEFLLKHTGAPDAQGKMVRPLVTSVDKLEGDTGPKAPTINIGWIPQPTLPVIDVKALPAYESDS